MEELLSKHTKELEARGYSKEQARDIVHSLSEIMSAFIAAAWDMHPAQLSVKARDKKQLSDGMKHDRISKIPKQNNEVETTVEPEEQ